MSDQYDVEVVFDTNETDPLFIHAVKYLKLPFMPIQGMVLRFVQGVDLYELEVSDVAWDVYNSTFLVVCYSIARLESEDVERRYYHMGEGLAQEGESVQPVAVLEPCPHGGCANEACSSYFDSAQLVEFLKKDGWVAGETDTIVVREWE